MVAKGVLVIFTGQPLNVYLAVFCFRRLHILIRSKYIPQRVEPLESSDVIDRKAYVSNRHTVQAGARRCYKEPPFSPTSPRDREERVEGTTLMPSSTCRRLLRV